MTTRDDDRAARMARYVATLYEVVRDVDRLPATTGALYGSASGSRNCIVCARSYIPTATREGDTGRGGGPPQVYCGGACRARATDRRRRGLRRAWRWCLACGGPFLCLRPGGNKEITPGQVTCPPPWPVSVYARSACGEARRRTTNREAARRSRARDAAA